MAGITLEKKVSIVRAVAIMLHYTQQDQVHAISKLLEQTQFAFIIISH